MKLFINSFLGLLSISFVYGIQITTFKNYNKFESPNTITASSSVDTIPIEDRYGDFITDKKYNPFDIKPSEIKEHIEYDAKTGNYIVYEKIGDEYYRTPTYLTFDEYMDYVAKDQERQYFNTLANIKSEKKSKSGKIDPIDKVDLQTSLVDRLFGGTEVSIKPQGSVDFSVGYLYNKNEQPGLQLQSQRRSQIDFPTPNIRMNVDGKIGKKLDLDFNYDTRSNFNFDRPMKLGFNSDAFSEDDILKKIEAGTVSFPLRSTLIQGMQSLFGLKTEMQFGRLRVTALTSMQRSRSNNLRLQNGGTQTEFIINPTRYDDNRHFFLTHYNRDNYERNLVNLPYIGTSFNVAQIEVWVSDDRGDFQRNATMVAAIADIGETDAAKFTSDPMINRVTCNALDQEYDNDIKCLPNNNANDIYAKLQSRRNVEDIDVVLKVLEGPEFRMQRSKDFEIFRGRKLNPNEFSYNPQLGTLSLNTRLRPNQVLGVSFNYFFTSNCDTVYQVGQISTNSLQSGSQTDTVNVEPPKVHFVKLLKPINQNTTSPIWDLMMKNVYNLGTNQLSQQDFEFDIFYEDDFNDGSLKRYIPEAGLNTVPLLQLFNLDRINRFGDPQPDGFFDYFPGVTVIERTGSIIFPVLEPFGNHLNETTFQNFGVNVQDTLISRYRFRELYTTIKEVIEHQGLVRNKFRMVGKSSGGSSTGEIYLGPNVPRGSVIVTAGGRTLVEGQDFEIDYSLGRLRIINPTFLAQGTPVNVRFEDNGIASFQQKMMTGLRFEYAFSKRSSLGFTFVSLRERPFLQKVNYGDDPIRNRIFGLDYNYSNEVPWVTKLVDKLPFYSTSEKSLINISAELAALKPGHARQIDLKYNYGEGEPTIYEREGLASIDDFEGAITNLNLGNINANQWTLASTPFNYNNGADFRAGGFAFNANRALLNWYGLDLAPATRRDGDNNNPYTRIIRQDELFQRPLLPGQQQLFTFDLSYFPNERGPYNYESANGYSSSYGFNNINNERIELRNPARRWAGIQRNFQNSNFEAANYENIEFWVLNPFMERPDGIPHAPNEDGKLIFHLGLVSEDVIKDDLLFFENALPTPQRRLPVTNTPLGRATVSIPAVNGFDISDGELQDVGIDGLNDDEERIKFQAWIIENGLENMESVKNDPSNDNFVFFNSRELNEVSDLISRMKGFNGYEGNAPINPQGDAQNNLDNQISRGNRFPDTEDINNNKTLDQAESFWEYEVNIKKLPNANEIDTTNLKYFRQTRRVSRGAGNPSEVWYRFQIPIKSGTSQNGITDFTGIQFMRMYFTGFETPKVFRLADFQLQRSVWRKQVPKCVGDGGINQEFILDDVGVEENSFKYPFGYQEPPGIVRNITASQYANIRQDERSLSMKFERLTPGCEFGISKVTELNLALYKRMQLYVHLEDLVNPRDSLKFGDLALVVRLGKDFPNDLADSIIREDNNFYEYILPLEPSVFKAIQRPIDVWPIHNTLNIPLEKFVDLRRERIANNLTPRGQIMEMALDPLKGDTIRMVGNPSLGNVKVIYLGILNRTNNVLGGEVWFNEMRLAGFDESFAFAGQSKIQLQLADLGEINLFGSYSSSGFGGIDKRLHERNRESVLQYDASISINAGKLLPKGMKMTVPMYAQYQKNIITPQFDPIDGDITVPEKLSLISNTEDRDSVRNLARQTITTKTFTLTNVRSQVGSTDKPWSPANVGLSYSFTQTVRTTPIILEDKVETRNIGLDYTYTKRSKYIEPLKFIKSKQLKILSDFNFNLLPSNFSFSSRMNDINSRRIFRQPSSPVFAFDDKRFNWERNYSMDWDITKSIRFGYRANTMSIIDQYTQTGIAPTIGERRWVDQFGKDVSDIIDVNPNAPQQFFRENLQRLGRSKLYGHNLSLNYKLPFRSIPILDWITASADYRADYKWEGGSLILIDPSPQPDGTLQGNTIRNGQNTSVNVGFDFTRLYNKSRYLKSIETGKGVRKPAPKQATPKPTNTSKKGEFELADEKKPEEDGKTAPKKDEKKVDKPRDPSMAERIFIRPLLSLRSIKVNYKDDRATSIPGFMPESRILGLSEGFTSPGWSFIAGAQPRITGENNWLQANQSWFNGSKRFNEQLSQTKRNNLDGKVLIEPFKDFSVDVTMKKNYQENHTEVFRRTSKTGEEYLQLAKYDIGSYDFSNIGLATFFNSSEGLYEQFKENRKVISRRQPNVDNPGIHPGNPAHPGGYGPLHSNVSIPALMSTYLNQDPYTVNLDPVSEYGRLGFIPKPNWQVNYNGLSKLKTFKKVFSNFTVKHGYSSTVRVARFGTQPQFNENNPFGTISDNGDYFARLEIPGIAINEQFAPLLGISFKTTKDLKFDFEYKSRRDLEMTTAELREAKGTEVTVGAGYVVRNIKSSKKKSNAKKRKKAADDDQSKDKLDPLAPLAKLSNKATTTDGRELRMNFNYSLRDDISLTYNLLTEVVPQADRGQRTIVLSPKVEYDLNKNLTLRFYFDYNRTIPKTTISFPTTTIRSGVSFRFNIN